jgi:hypothetical protein
MIPDPATKEVYGGRAGSTTGGATGGGTLPEITVRIRNMMPKREATGRI